MLLPYLPNCLDYDDYNKLRRPVPLIPEILQISGGVNFEIKESDLVRNCTIWISGNYGYSKTNTRGSKVNLRCRSRVQAKCKGTAVVDCAEDPAKLVVIKPHSCGGSANIGWAQFTEKKGKKKPRKDKERPASSTVRTVWPEPEIKLKEPKPPKKEYQIDILNTS